jgi:putative acetyltransferase
MISLRPAHPEDATVIAALFSASRRLLTFLPELHSPEEDQVFIRNHILSAYVVTVAVHDGQIAGYMAEGPGWIEQLYMHPREVRTGIGSALIEVAKMRHERLELWCFRDNIAGRSFYEKHGFVAVAETDGSENEAKAPDIRYRWVRG